jgi:uncharacterized protein
MRVRLIAAGLLLVTIAAGVARAQSLPALTEPVNDTANVIDTGTRAELDRRIRALQTASGDVVVVATVNTFAPYGSIEEYATKLFERAGIGARSKDNGALVVLAVKDKRVRIEVGYGLEEFITDGFSGETIREAMLPAFRRGDYSQGMLAGTTSVINRIADRRGVTLADVPREIRDDRGSNDPDIGTLIFLAIVLLLFILRITRFRGPGVRRRGGWGRSTWSGWHGGVGGFGGGGFGGGGGGSFGGFGGGRSGGGGASGGW